MSAILHAFFLLLCVIAIPNIINMVLLSVPAAVLFMAGFKLAKPSSFISMYKQEWSQFIPFAVTIIGIVLTDLIWGIGLGMGASVIILLRNSYKNSHFCIGKNRQEARK